ncbi:MAG: phage head closure protein [Candidatus Paceibacterota bacterium]|jgi:SPP1 family predicted phage head-tail adaptor
MPKILFKYPIKDKQIKLFREITSIVTGNQDRLTKAYEHPEGTHLWAYVRQLSANERLQMNAEQDQSDIEFVINKRPLVAGMLIEFKDKTYQIGAPDSFEFYNTELKFRASEVSPRTYTSTTYKAWGV